MSTISNASFMRSAAAGAMICGSLLLPGQAWGQETAGNQQDTASGEIIVTALRRAESVQTTPIAISVVDGDDMLRENVNTTEEILRDLPGVEIRKAPPGASIYIRGIATQQGGGELDPGISFNIDGVYTPFIETSAFSFYDVQRVEVLKGPQGTLYGRNAIAGVVNVITKSPEFDGFSGFAQASVGNYDYIGFTGALNIPVADNAALRVAGDYQDNSGYLNLGSDDVGVWSGRAKFLWEPTTTFRIEVRGLYADFEGKGSAPVIYPYRDDPWTQFPTAPNVPAQDAWIAGGSLQADLDLGFATLTYIPAYYRKKFHSATDGGGTFIKSYVMDKQHTEEVRLASNSTNPLSWIVGGYYYRGINDTGLAFFTTIDQHVVTTSLAAFGQATLSLTDALRITGGLRFTRDKKVEDGVNTLGGMVISTLEDIRWSWNKWTWRAGLEYDVGPESMFYASVSTGFKAGGTSLVAGPDAVFDPETLTAYEGGLKNRLADGTVTLNLAGFYYDYGNYQASFLRANPDFGGAFVRRIANAGDAKIWGGEAEFGWTPTPDDSLRVTAAYTKGEFGSYLVPTIVPGVFEDYSGSNLSAVPWSVSASYSHDFHLGADGHLVPLLSARYNSGAWRDARQYADAGAWGPAGTYANPISFQDAFVKLDFNLSYTWHEDRYRISAYVKNITDKAVFTGASASATASSAWLEPPRTFGASFYVAW